MCIEYPFAAAAKIVVYKMRNPSTALASGFRLVCVSTGIVDLVTQDHLRNTATCYVGADQYGPEDVSAINFLMDVERPEDEYGQCNARDPDPCDGNTSSG